MASGGPGRPAGVPCIIVSPGNVSGVGSWTTPGEIALTRTPDGPNSAAQARVRVSIAPLLELYRAATGMPRRAIQEPRLMMAPPPAAAMAGATAAVRKNGAFTLTA
jgi:hypothetical protein